MANSEARSRNVHIFLVTIACGLSAVACTELKGDEFVDAGGSPDAAADTSSGGDADDKMDMTMENSDADADDAMDMTMENSDADASWFDGHEAFDSTAESEAETISDTSEADAPDPKDADGGPDGAADASADACIGGCSEGGVARCASTSQIQICASLNGCMQWVDIGACPATALCCAGSCVAADSTNCYQCGVACTGGTPSCSSSFRKCVCTDEACAANGRTCNATTGVCDPPAAADLYVDATATIDGDGSLLRPFRTITAGISAANALGPPKSIYVAAGTYDEALGERFPLVVRGISIQGAGAGKTVLVGTGEFDHAAEGGSYNAQYWATLLVGDPLLSTRISGLSAQPASAGVASNHFGIVCDRGSASGAVQAPAGQSAVDRVVLGPGYHVSVIAATSTNPLATGCNLQMTGSTLTGGWVGLHAVGCGMGVGNVPVVLDVGGEAPTSGNTISGMQLPGGGWAALIKSCTKSGVFRYNSFIDSGMGIAIDEVAEGAGTAHSFVFRHNRFEHLSLGGISVMGLATETPAVADEISDNSFVDISAAVVKDSGYVATGLSADLGRIGKVRRNIFIGNDVGMWFQVADGAGGLGDFGTAGDPGNNIFRCNSSLTADHGADVMVVSSATGTIPLVGNFWDHNPPSIQALSTFAEGSDVAMTTAPYPAVDTAGAGLATAACPTGRAVGP